MTRAPVRAPVRATTDAARVPAREGVRRPLLLLAAGVLALAGLSGLVQLGAHLAGMGRQPGVLLGVHAVAVPLALVSAVGIVRRRAWTSRAVLLWTIAMLAMFAAFGPATDLPPAESRLLWAPGAVVVAFAALVLRGLRAPAR
jgi:hypothetical protein